MRSFFLFLFFLSLSCQSVNAHHSSRHVVAAKTEEKVPKPLPLTISQIIGNGAFLMLSDDSVWAIAPSDTLLSSAWISAAEITIQPSSDPAFPVLLFNSITQDSVRARKSSLEEVKQKVRASEAQKQQFLLERKKVEEKSQELKQ